MSLEIVDLLDDAVPKGGLVLLDHVTVETLVVHLIQSINSDSTGTEISSIGVTSSAAKRAFIEPHDFDQARKMIAEQEKDSKMEKNGVDLEESAAFWRKSAARAAALSPNKYEKRTPLPARIVWTGALGDFENFQNKVEGHYAQIGAGYLFDEEIQAKFLEKGYEAILEFPDEGISSDSIQKGCRRSIWSFAQRMPTWCWENHPH